MNGYFLGMNDIDIGAHKTDIRMNDVIIILHKYFYSNKSIMDTLKENIKQSIGADSVDINGQPMTKFSLTVKISKSMKKQMSKECKKNGQNDICVEYFYMKLQEVIRNFLLSIIDSFRDAVNNEYRDNNISSTIPKEIVETFMILVQSPNSANLLINVISLLERDNYIIIQFL